jgi:hypothetical protein
MGVREGNLHLKLLCGTQRHCKVVLLAGSVIVVESIVTSPI